jgi:hydrogenase maturation protease
LFLVLAYGNTLRRDDGVAWEVAERLRSRPLPEGVQIRTLHQLTPELSDDIARSGGVVFIDAATQGAPGEIQEMALLPSAALSPLGHSLSPGTLLALGMTLFGRAPHAWLVTVTGADFGLGEGLSERVEAAVDETVGRVALLIGRAGAILRPCP